MNLQSAHKDIFLTDLYESHEQAPDWWKIQNLPKGTREYKLALARERNRRFYQRNRERMVAYSSKWQKDNNYRARKTELERKRRAEKKSEGLCC